MKLESAVALAIGLFLGLAYIGDAMKISAAIKAGYAPCNQKTEKQAIANGDWCKKT